MTGYTIISGGKPSKDFWSERYEGHISFAAAFIQAERVAKGYGFYRAAETALASVTHYDAQGNIVWQRKNEDIPRNRWDGWLAATGKVSGRGPRR